MLKIKNSERGNSSPQDSWITCVVLLVFMVVMGSLFWAHEHKEPEDGMREDRKSTRLNSSHRL